jgi:iron(III) transport system permease protein
MFLRAGTLLIALITLIPLFFVLVYTYVIGPDQAYQLIVRPRVGELLFNTVRLTLAVIVTTGVIGTVAAWLTERSNLPFSRLWTVLLVAPLAIPSFVNSYAWISLTPRVEGYLGAILVITLSHFPFVYLPVAAALRVMDPALEECSRSLGKGPWRTFTEVVIPQLRPALLGGLLLVTLHLLAELGALEMLRFPTFTTAIYDQYQSTFNSPAANMLAGVLVVGCLLALVAELTLRGRGRYARLGSGTARPISRARLGAFMPIAAIFVLIVVALSLALPLGALVYWLRVGTSTSFPLDEFVAITLASLQLGLAGSVITTILALPVAWVAVRQPGPVSVLTERATYIGHSLPGIVVALSLVSITVRFARPIYQTSPLLIAAYVILFFPLALVTIRAALMQARPVFDEVGRSLGAAPLSVLRRITLPLIAPGLGAGAALVFISAVTELTATLLLAPIGTTTLATKFWQHADSIAYGAAAPYAVLMVIVSAPMTYLLTRQIASAARR